MTKHAAPEFARVTTRGLWTLRQTMLDGNEAVGRALLEGRASGPAREGVHMRAVLVERVDAELLSRGETVPEPWWAVEETTEK